MLSFTTYTTIGADAFGILCNVC